MTVVMCPSYGIGAPTGASMVESYTWSQDALRFGAFAGGKGEGGEDVRCDHNASHGQTQSLEMHLQRALGHIL